MNALEALSKIHQDPSLWARPSSWAQYRSGQALCWDGDNPTGIRLGGGWLLVPTSRGGQRAYLPVPSDLFGEWEVVEPEVVLRERESS